MKTLLSLILGIAFLTSNGFAASSSEPISPDLFQPEPVKTLTGKASFYGGRWAGRKTANGEIYRPNTMTAAHKSLPFGTFVKVTNMRNGSSTIVRINNRGPYVKGRIIDLSVAAAKDLHMINSGVVPVRVEVLERLPEGEKAADKG